MSDARIGLPVQSRQRAYLNIYRWADNGTASHHEHGQRLSLCHTSTTSYAKDACVETSRDDASAAQLKSHAGLRTY